jgi:hypothetical protein
MFEKLIVDRIYASPMPRTNESFSLSDMDYDAIIVKELNTSIDI